MINFYHFPLFRFLKEKEKNIHQVITDELNELVSRKKINEMDVDKSPIKKRACVRKLF